MNPIDKPSILILINVRWWNATAFYAVNIARLLHQNGHKVFVGCDPAYPAYQKAVACGLNTVALSFYGYNPVKLYKNFMRMQRLIKEEGIEILNPHRSEDHFFALLAKRATGRPLVLTRGDQRRIKSGLLSRRKYARCDAVIATCQSIVDQNRHIFDAMASRVTVIHGSVDEPRFDKPSDSRSDAWISNIAADKVTIGLVGRISLIKGQRTLIQAAALALKERQDLQFVISGNERGITVSELRAMAVESGIEKHLIILPEVARVADLINALDICVAASVGSETISRVALEYLYCGKPVICTRVNAIGEIILPGVNGELFEPYDHRSLARAVLKLARDPELRQRYGNNSRRLYQERYSEKIFYHSYADVLTKAATAARQSSKRSDWD